MKTLVCALALLVSAPVLAAGFLVDTQSGRATGMASSLVADVGGPSAVLFNPADIIRGQGVLDLEIGDTLIWANFAFTPLGSTTEIKGDTGLVPPFTAYGTYGITRDLSVGVGVFETWGLKVSWPDDWIGRELITESSLATYNFNPELAYRVGPFQIGAGAQIMRATVDLKRKINFVDSEGSVDLGGAAWGFGGNVGVLAHVIPDVLSVGATYRSRVKLDFNDGKAHFSNIPPEFAGSEPGQIRDQKVTTSVTIPDWVTVGFSLRPIEKLHVDFEADYVSWQLFKELRVDFEDPALSEVQPKNWKHTWNYHLGAEYALTQMFDVRVGAIYDVTPSPPDTLGPDLPDGDRWNLSVGVGFHTGGFFADVGYQQVILLDSTSTLPEFPGTYSGSIPLLSISLRYKL